MTGLDNLPGIQPDSYIPLRVQVYDALRDAIVGGQLKAGQRLVEVRLCKQLGVSRSPLREALRSLEADGFVRFIPRQGAIVTEFTQRDIADLFAVREAMEGLTASLAAEKITAAELDELEDICREMGERIQARDVPAVVSLNSQYHDVVLKAGRNKWLVSLMTSLRDHIRRVYGASVELRDRGPQSLQEHLAILHALRSRDTRVAEELAKEHVRRAEEAAVSAEALPENRNTGGAEYVRFRRR